MPLRCDAAAAWVSQTLAAAVAITGFCVPRLLLLLNEPAAPVAEEALYPTWEAETLAVGVAVDVADAHCQLSAALWMSDSPQRSLCQRRLHMPLVNHDHVCQHAPRKPGQSGGNCTTQHNMTNNMVKCRTQLAPHSNHSTRKPMLHNRGHAKGWPASRAAMCIAALERMAAQTTIRSAHRPIIKHKHWHTWQCVGAYAAGSAPG